MAHLGFTFLLSSDELSSVCLVSLDKIKIPKPRLGKA